MYTDVPRRYAPNQWWFHTITVFPRSGAAGHVTWKRHAQWFWLSDDIDFFVVLGQLGDIFEKIPVHRHCKLPLRHYAFARALNKK